MTLGKIIKEYREKHQLSQRQFASLCDVSNGYISMLEDERNPKTNEPIVPSIATMKKLAKAMGTSLNELMSTADDMEISMTDQGFPIADIKNLSPVEAQRIPMLGRIACGKPIYAEEEHECYVAAGTKMDADFCLTCQGDSMTGAGIHDGDIVFIKQQEAVDNGQVAAIIIGDEATLKRLYYFPETAKLVLQAENPKYEPLVYTGEELNGIKILGRAVAYMSAIV